MAVQLVLATYPAETRLHLKVLDPACGTLASTTGTDSDWIVKFIDVYPEKYAADPKMGGYQLMIASDVFRGRYHKSFEKPEPIPANAVLHYQIAFPANDHVFKQGHRIMVQVQSSWFPVIDRTRSDSCQTSSSRKSRTFSERPSECSARASMLHTSQCRWWSRRGSDGKFNSRVLWSQPFICHHRVAAPSMTNGLLFTTTTASGE